LPEFVVDLVVARGVVLAEKGKLKTEIAPFLHPENVKRSVKMKRAVGPKDFDVIAPQGANSVVARTIGVVENQAPTRALECRLAVRNGLVETDLAQDVCQIAIVERHHATGTVTNGFVSGFGYNTECAVASSVAHDSHHIIVVGTSKSDMAMAANTLAKVQGGVVVVSRGEVLALVELPIAGLMSDDRAEIVAAKMDKVIAAMGRCGATLNNVFMQHSLLGLVVIPTLRISDAGLVDVTTFSKVSLIV
jgi:adenine deaminase